MEKTGVSINKAAKREGVSRKSVKRAVLAIKEGRPIQKHGRPQLLTDAQEGQLASWVQEKACINEFPSYDTFVKKVGYHISAKIINIKWNIFLTLAIIKLLL